jgi:hypothetical protein
MSLLRLVERGQGLLELRGRPLLLFPEPRQLLLARCLCLAERVLEPLDLSPELLAFLGRGLEGAQPLERRFKLLLQPLALVGEVSALVGMPLLLIRESRLKPLVLRGSLALRLAQ